jgi:dolichol-phosphate mannosyltransferase
VTARPAPGPSPSPRLSVVIPALHEGENLALLLPALRETLGELGVDHEILVVTNDVDEATAAAATDAAASVVLQEARGYGGALLAGFARARGAWVLTMDADLSHPAPFVRALWSARERADVVIASRYVPGGRADMPLGRFLLSRILNRVFSRGLSLGVRDMSSGFRLLRTDVVRGVPYAARDFDIVQEILVRAHAAGWRVAEVPFHYQPRRHGSSHARVLKFGVAYLRTFRSLWRLRNSRACADYDSRAFDSVIPLQRYWHRQRVRHVTGLLAGEGRVLDVGCGSSRIIAALPPGSVAVDVRLEKLRVARQYGRALVQASATRLPFGDDSFPCVVCSQVLEHVPKSQGVLDELVRVLRPGGRLVLGTPDYGGWQWVWIEKAYRLAAPGGYADEHIAHYTRRELLDALAARGLAVEAERYILKAELILASRKPLAGTPR